MGNPHETQCNGVYIYIYIYAVAYLKKQDKTKIKTVRKEEKTQNTI